MTRKSGSRPGRIYRRVLLRESYREKGKVKKRTIANLSACSEQEIKAMQLGLEHKDDLTEVGTIDASVSLRQGPSVGAVWLVYQCTSVPVYQCTRGATRRARPIDRVRSGCVVTGCCTSGLLPATIGWEGPTNP